MHFSALAAALAASAVLTAPSALALPSKRADVCNGRAELCGRSYGNTTFLGAHDSFAISDESLDLAADQEIGIVQQLDFGVRMLQAQAHLSDLDFSRELHFCHTSCFLYDGGKVKDYLKTVKGWLDAHPQEVLTLIFTNGDRLAMKVKWEPAFIASGMDQLAYVPPHQPMKRDEWPTLGEMIDSGKRVVVFIDYDADNGGVPYLLPEFPNLWEPPFSVTDPAFPCRVDRTAGPNADADHLHMLNHNLNEELLGIDDVLIPVKRKAPTTNGVPSILANAAGCAPLAGDRAPNFVMLDFVSEGAGLQAVDILNGFA